MRMHRHYTQEEILFIKMNISSRSYIDMTKLFNERFGLQLSLKQIETLMYKHKLYNGIGAYNGFASYNKGKKNKPQQGQYRPIGTERIISGYIEIKTADPSVWKRKHTAIWEAVNGKVPQGHVVIFGDGNRRNFDLNNLLLVSRAELAVMNQMKLIYPHEDLTRAGKTIAVLKMAITKRKKIYKKRINHDPNHRRTRLQR